MKIIKTLAVQLCTGVNIATILIAPGLSTVSHHGCGVHCLLGDLQD